MNGCNRLYTLDVSCFEDKDFFSRWYDRVDRQRQEKIDAFKPDGSKRLSLGAGVLLEYALKEIGIDKFDLIYGPQGKPSISGHGDVFFNLSHSGTVAVIGISDREIGVDIEEEKEFKESLINFVFNEKDKECAQKHVECGALASMDLAYTRLWTVKESIMKHSGKGLGLEPKKISISFSGDKLISSLDAYDTSDLRFSCFDIPGYQLTVCSEYEDFSGPIDIFGEISR